MKYRVVFLATSVSTLLGSTAAAVQVDLLQDVWTPRETCDAPGGPIRVEPLGTDTWMPREPSCLHREAPFMFLLVGADKALLVDTGTQDGSDLVSIVRERLARGGLGFNDLTVVHTHSHLDHRSGDEAFVGAGATVVGPTLEDVVEFWRFDRWPEGKSSIDLGERLVEVIPLPGHNENSIVLFDHQTGILLTGDSMLRGRITIGDLAAFRTSLARLSSFIAGSNVSVVLGGHLERNAVPVGLGPETVSQLQELGARVGLFRPVARGADFTVLYLRPILIALVGGLALFGVNVVRSVVKRVGRS